MNGLEGMAPVAMAISAVAALGTFALYRLRQAGLFQVILFDWKALPGDKTLMFKSYKGSYRGIRQSIQELLELVQDRPLESELWQIYYDDPAVVGENNCRYSLGFSAVANSETEMFLAKNGFIKVNDVPTTPKFLHTTFPYTGPLSVMISVARVYSAFGVESKRRGLASSQTSTNKDRMNGYFVEVTRTREGLTEFFYCMEEYEPLLRPRFKE